MSRWRKVDRLVSLSIAGALVACTLACGRAGPVHPAAPGEPGQKPKPRPVAASVEVRRSLLDQIQGKWVAQSPQDESERLEWTVEGNKINAQTSGGQVYKGTLKINEQVSPIQVDIQFTDCSDTSLNGQTMQGILKLEGTKTTFCLGEPGDSARPARFDRSEGLLIAGEKK